MGRPDRGVHGKPRRGIAVLAVLALAAASLVAAGSPAASQVTPSVIPGFLWAPEGNSGTTVVNVPVTLSEASADEVTVDWITHFQGNAPGAQATPVDDYVVASGQVTFAPGETEQTVPVTVNGDTTEEPEEYVLISFRYPVNASLGGFLGLGAAYIQDDDALRTVVPGFASMAEGDSGTSVVNVPVTLSGLSGVVVTVDWITHFQGNAPGAQATPVDDYVVASGQVTFAPGETEQTVPVTVNGDTTQEPEEYVLISFRYPVNASLGGFLGLGAAYIEDDDAPPTIIPGSGSVAEGDTGSTVLDVPVTLSRSWDEIVTVDWRTVFVDGLADPQAEPAVDYEIANGTLTFVPGDTEESAQINVVGDVFTEPDEKVIVELENPVNATLASTQGTGTIVNDDATSIVLTPDTGLNGGDTVTVDGAGYPPGATIGTCQAIANGSGGTDDCMAGTEASVTTAGADGTFSFTKRLYRWGHVASAGAQVDCVAPETPCVIATAVIFSSTEFDPATVATADLEFATPPDPPATLGEIVVTPSTDLVHDQVLTVTGTGFRPDQQIDIYQCLGDPVPTPPRGCDWSPRFNTATDGSGNFETTITAQQTLFGETNDCGVQQCHIGAWEAVDWLGTFVSTPIYFAGPAT